MQWYQCTSFKARTYPFSHLSLSHPPLNTRHHHTTPHHTIPYHTIHCSTVQADLSVARDRLAAANAENDSLRATVEALRAELRTKEASANDLEVTAHGLESDRETLREEVARAHERASRVQDELDDTRRQLQMELNTTRAQLSSAEAKLQVFQRNESSLHERLAGKDELITQLQGGKTRAEAELAELRSQSQTEQQTLQNKLHAARERERVLEDDLKQLHRYIGRRESAATPAPAPHTTSSVTRSTTTATTAGSAAARDPLSSRRYTYTSSYRVPNVVDTTTTVSRPLETSTYRYTTTSYSNPRYASTTRTVIEEPSTFDTTVNACGSLVPVMTRSGVR